MFFVYDKKKKVFSPKEETDFSSHKIMERQDLEEWVIKSPETILGEEILILANEYDKFDKTDERLDLLGLDKNGKLVIIELKRDESGKTVDLQAIKYAAYCSTMTMSDLIPIRKEFLNKSTNRQVNDEYVKKELYDYVGEEFEELDNKPRIILVAKDFRQEVTATTLWLRKYGVNISCIKLTPYVIDANRLGFVSSILIPLPEAKDFLIKSERKEGRKSTLTRTKREYVEFYEELIKRMEEKNFPIYLPQPKPQAYYQIPTGISGVHFEWGFHGRPRSSFGVELHFEKGSKPINEKLLNEMRDSIPNIKKESGEKVILQKDWGKRWARLYIEKNEGKLTDELKEWAVSTMIILHRILQPKLESLKE